VTHAAFAGPARGNAVPHSRSLTSVVLALSIISAAPLGAQIIKVGRTSSPFGWISASAGIIQPRNISDGTTGSVWDLSTAFQYRGSIEMALQNQGAIGVSASWADVPLRYYDYSGDFPTCSEASNGCDAHVKVWSALAEFRMGGGQGFHQIIEIGAGVLGYQDFTADDDGTRLGQSRVDLDFALGVSYGFGYSLSPRFQIGLVQDYTATMHQKENLSGNVDTFTEHYTTRLMLRYGLGSRSRL